jgi:pilus assembly protein CpaB
MRGGSKLPIILGVFILLLAFTGAYFYFFSAKLMPAAGTPSVLPTNVPDVSVVGASIDIEAGTLISDTDALLEMRNIPGEQFEANKLQYFTSPDDIRNMKALVKLRGNEPLRKDEIGPAGLSLKIPASAAGQPSVKAFPVQVNNLTGVADLIQPGDYVDLMASFNLDVTTFRPGVPQTNESGSHPVLVEQLGNEGSVKVLLQDVQVLDIIKSAPPQPASSDGSAPSPTPAPQSVEPVPTPQSQQLPKNTSATTLQDGNWVLIIGVTNQEAEVLRFALDRGLGISTLLRRAGDHTTEHTVGSTLRVLIDNYGMPVPSSLPPAQQAGPVQLPNVPALPLEETQVFAPSVTAEPTK